MKLFLVLSSSLSSTRHRIVRAEDEDHARRIALRTRVDRALAGRELRIVRLSPDGRPGTIWSYSHIPDMD